MNASEQPIDVEPLSAQDSASGARGGKTLREPSFRDADAQRGVTQATLLDEPGAAFKKTGRTAGFAQAAIGGALIVVGVPMLILPGPGLVSIGAGVIVARRGIKKILGR